MPHVQMTHYRAKQEEIIELLADATYKYNAMVQLLLTFLSASKAITMLHSLDVKIMLKSLSHRLILAVLKN